MNRDSDVDCTFRALPDSAGRGVVRLVHRVDADRDAVWSALSERDRLEQWLGTLEGELREGAELRGFFLASGWEGICRIEACDPPRRLVVHTQSPDQPDGTVEITLRAVAERTELVLEDRGVPLDEIAAYGAGDRIHLEDLAAHLAGRGRCDPRQRWAELFPGLRDSAASLTAADTDHGRSGAGTSAGDLENPA